MRNYALNAPVVTWAVDISRSASHLQHTSSRPPGTAVEGR